MTTQFYARRLWLFGCVAALWILAAAVKGLARPWGVQHGPDWLTPILGSAPSLLAGMSLPLCFLAMQPMQEFRDYNRVYLQAVAIMLIAELVEPGLSGSTFDWLDVAASVVGVGGAKLIVRPLVRAGCCEHLME